MRPTLAGALLCTIAMTILGSSFAISRLILGYPTLTSQAARYLLAAALLALLLRHRSLRGGPDRIGPDRLGRGPVGRGDLLRLSAIAATGLVAFNICVLAALRHGDPASLGTIVGGTPLVLAVLGPVLRGGRPAARLLVAGALVVAGVALVEGGGHTSAAGFGYALGALAGEACFSLLAAPLLPRLGAVRLSAWACLLAVPQLLVAALVTGEWRHWRTPTPTEAGALLYIAVVLTVVAFICWYTGLQRLGVERAGMFAGLLPVTTLAAATIMSRLAPSPGQLIGTLVVAAGLVAGLIARPAKVNSPTRAGGDPAPARARQHQLDPAPARGQQEQAAQDGSVVACSATRTSSA